MHMENSDIAKYRFVEHYVLQTIVLITYNTAGPSSGPGTGTRAPKTPSQHDLA